MEASLGLSQTLKTEQTLSPQMLQSLALLPMPILELKAHIQSEIERNPALEIPDSEFSLSLPDPKPERELGDGMDDADASDYEVLSYSGQDSTEGDAYGYTSGDFDPEASDRKQMMIENSSVPGKTLKEHLMAQLGEVVCTKTVYDAAEMLISALDPNGFLTMSPEALFEGKGFSGADIDTAISTVQGFDPAGVCVPDFRASLILQAKASGMGEEDLHIFARLVNEHLEKLRLGKFKEVSHSLRISEEDLQTFFSILKGLTPYPGADFTDDGVTGIAPDFSIHSKDGSLVLDINRTDIPALEISPDFEGLADGLKGPEAKEAASYIRDSVRQARTLIAQVNLRFQTLYKAALAMMDYQREFFLKGPRFLKTMTLKDIADRIEVHETTMSRLAQSKYVDTDWGMFQLKYFFSQGVPTSSGSSESVSRNVVKDMIAEIVSENGALSDQKISDILLSRGIKCARRTVGKYRGELNIDSSYTR